MYKNRKYALPDFLRGVTDQVNYERWLRRKGVAHVRRDRERGSQTATNKLYQIAIHSAVVFSNGLDAYTGEALDWHLLSKYNNEASKKGGRKYKAEFYMLPSLDHVGDGNGPANFKICAWRTNDAKNDMSLHQFIDLCKKVVAHNS